MLFATCSYSLFGQSSFYHRMETAIDIGTYESEFFMREHLTRVSSQTTMCYLHIKSPIIRLGTTYSSS